LLAIGGVWVVLSWLLWLLAWLLLSLLLLTSGYEWLLSTWSERVCARVESTLLS
jgi:hypothetical protein